MKEEIPKLKEMMKELSTLADKTQGETTKSMIKDIIYNIKDLCEILDY